MTKSTAINQMTMSARAVIIAEHLAITNREQRAQLLDLVADILLTTQRRTLSQCLAHAAEEYRQEVSKGTDQ